MSKAKVLPFLIVGLVLSYFAFITVLTVPVFTVDTSYYYRTYSDSAWLVTQTPFIFVLALLTFFLTVIAFIVCLVKLRNGTSKGPGYFLMFCVFLEIVVGFSIVIYAIIRSDVTLSGGYAYLFFTIPAQILGFIGASRFNLVVSYIPPSSSTKKTSSSQARVSYSSSSYSSSSSTSTSSSSYNSSPTGTLKVVKFPSEVEYDDGCVVEFYNNHVVFRFTDKSSGRTTPVSFYYTTPIVCSTTVSEDCVFFAVKSRNYSSYDQSEKEANLRLNNINTNKVNTYKMVSDLEKELKKHFASLTDSGFQANNGSNSTLNYFESEYGMGFETFKSSFKTSYCGKNAVNESLTIAFNKSKKLFFVAGENEKDPSIRLLAKPRSQFRADEYKILLASTNLSGIKMHLYNYSDIIDVKYYDRVLDKTMDTKPAMSKLDKESDPNTGYSHVILYFKTNPAKSVYINKDQMTTNDDLASLVNSFKAKKNPSAAEVKAQAKDKSQVAQLLRKDEQKPVAKAAKSNVVLSKDAPAPKAQAHTPSLDKSAKAKPSATPKLDKAPAKPAAPDNAHQGKTKADRLKELKELLDADIITQEEYNSARESIIKD